MSKVFWDWFNEIKPKLGQRADTFAKMFEYLDSLGRPVEIVETGCLRKTTDFLADGQSTVLFDHYVQCVGGHVTSVDIDHKNVEFASERVSKRVTVHCSDSIDLLRRLAGNSEYSPDLVYLDSLDYMESDPFHTALHCANEFFAIRPAIRPDTLVVCDDTPTVIFKDVLPPVEYLGKGKFVATHAEAVGADQLFSTYQVGWVNMVGAASRTTDEDVDQLIGRARDHVEADRTKEAAACYRTVLTKTKTPASGVDRVARGEACAFYARLAGSVGHYGTSADWYRDAIMADPRAVDYRLEMVVKAYRPQLMWELAEQECLRCIEIEPDNPKCWRILGDVATEMCNVKDALWAYDKQLALAPDDPHAMLDRCVIALDTADYDTVRTLAAKVLETKQRANGIHILAMIENRSGNHERAIEMIDEALAAGCDNKPTAHWNKSLSLHALGRYREGWKEHEWRKKQVNNPALSMSFMRFARPLWEGQPPPARIHVHAEAGLGDNLVCARFLNTLTERGYEVCYEVHKELVDLMRRSFPQVEVVQRTPDYPGAIGLKQFDYHLPIGSMGHALDMDIDNLPWPGSYLKPDPHLVEKYDHKLGIHGKRVGLCWSSGIREFGIWIKEYGKRKSMSGGAFAPIVHQLLRQGMMPVNLQLGPERQDKLPTIIDVLPAGRPSFDETAALIANLDLVITVDTAVAHCAGAMGKPVWVLMQRDGASWHFMCWQPGFAWNERSPWYPTARLFRQHKFHQPHYWDDVIGDVVEALRAEAKQKAA